MTKELIARFAVAITLLSMSLGLAACNTVEGAGQDIENTGEAIQDSANENKP